MPLPAQDSGEIMRLHRMLAAVVLALATCALPHPALAGPLVTDPLCDTFGVDWVKHDIAGVRGTLVSGVLTFEVFFKDPVELPFNLSALSVVGFLNLDTDRNDMTAGPAQPMGYGPRFAGLGTDFSVDLFSGLMVPDRVDVVDTSSGLAVGAATLALDPTGRTLSVEIPLGILGNSNGEVNFGLVVGTFNDASDVVLSLAPGATAVPEPSGLLLLAAGMGATLLRRRLMLGRGPIRL